MVLRLYDTRDQATRVFEPLVAGQIGLYVCGPTVQSAPHIGHLRSALSYDLLRRWFTYRGYAVTVVRNVTDIDDKILAATTGEEWWALAYRVELEFSDAYRAIGILPPTYEPRATASISQMQELIGRLIEGGHAYAAPDASGDVYFDTASWPAYGELTRQQRTDMLEADDADPRGKRDARDFALWKGSKPGEPATASWPSPWGAGRPGWHIECSAMAARYLGSSFDIHGGGRDLRFPHHENELAQSTADGQHYARYWVHNGLIEVGGQKMSKSLGNSVFAADVLGSARPVVVRYALAAAHYRSTLEFQPGALAEAAESFGRIERFVSRAAERFGTDAPSTVVPDAFAAAMDDDLGVPQALAVLHETVRAGNIALDTDDAVAAAAAYAATTVMLSVLGFDLRAPAAGAVGSEAEAALTALVEQQITRRADARTRRDFAEADRIRIALAEAGVALEDGADGTRWTLVRS